MIVKKFEFKDQLFSIHSSQHPGIARHITSSSGVEVFAQQELFYFFFHTRAYTFFFISMLHNRISYCSDAQQNVVNDFVK